MPAMKKLTLAEQVKADQKEWKLLFKTGTKKARLAYVDTYYKGVPMYCAMRADAGVLRRHKAAMKAARAAGYKG